MAQKKYGLKVVNIRLVKERTLYSITPVRSPDTAMKVVQEFMSDFDREALGVLCVDNVGNVLNVHFCAVGALDRCIFDPKQIFKATLLSNAAGILVFHNHPSGDLTPSKEDVNSTKRLKEACTLMDISFLDHIIIGSNGCYYSFMENQIL